MNSKRDATVMTANNARQGCYRLRRKYLIVGIMCMVSFLATGVGSTCAAYWNIDGSFARPKLTALIFGVFWSCFTLLGLWLILAYFRFRLYIADTAITEVGVIGSTTLQLADATRIAWRLIPEGGSVVIQTTTARVKISFDNYTPEERNELITFCRDRFAPEIQQGWSRFVERFLEPTPERKRQSRVASVIILLLLAFFAGNFIYFWVIGLGVQYLVIGIVNALVALWYLWRLRVRRFQSSAEMSA